MKNWQRWLMVIMFAAAMAWVEAAVVVYLRTLISRLEPYQSNPLPQTADLGTTELVREAATLVMLAMVGGLAGGTGRQRLGYAMIAFGVWDILYYAWLRLICGWPASLFDWDILFLLPMPWWGPVLAPVLVAALMTIGGTLISQFEGPAGGLWPSRLAWGLNLGGVALALYVFMAEALRAAAGGVEAVRNALPQTFDWRLFLVALALLAAPIIEVSWQLVKKPKVHLKPFAAPQE